MTTVVDSPANPEFDFSDRLRKVRRSVARMTQTDMATELNVSRARYEAWESGRNVPDDIVAVAKRVAFRWPGRVTASWMLGVDNDGGRGDGPGGGIPQDSTKRRQIELMQKRRSRQARRVRLVPAGGQPQIPAA